MNNYKQHLLGATLALATALSITPIAMGLSVKKTLLGKTIYNAAGRSQVG